MKHRNKKGFTLIELLISVFIVMFICGVVVWLGFYGIICKGNFWYTPEGVLKELRIDHPEVTKVLKDTRNIWEDSVFTVENEDGTRSEYCLDTNILWNYEFEECSE